MLFVWDPSKAEANFTDHGIRFFEAVAVLEDDFALTREDPDSHQATVYHPRNDQLS